MKINRLLTTITLGSLISSSLLAQQPMTLSLEEMFMLAEENSKTIKVSQLAVREATEGIDVAKNDRLPDIEASLSLSYIGDGWMTDRNFKNGTKAPMPHFGNNFAFKATQAVYTGGAIHAGIEMSRLQKQMAQAELEQNRQNIRFMLVAHYLDLFLLNNQKQIYQKNIAQTKLLIEEIKSAFREGTALASDVTRYELQLKDLELGYTQLTNRMAIVNREMVTTLGLDNETLLIPDSSLLTLNVDRQNEQHWQSAKLEAPAMQLAQLGTQMSRKKQELIRAGRRPTIGLMATNNFDGPILIEVPPIDKNFNYWFVGVNVSYKFDSLFKKNKQLRQARTATFKAQEQQRLTDEQLSNDIYSAYIYLEEAYTRLDTKKKNVQLAYENYEVVHSRYLNGLSLITDMLDASNIQLASELELANAQIGILYQYFLLRKTTGTL